MIYDRQCRGPRLSLLPPRPLNSLCGPVYNNTISDTIRPIYMTLASALQRSVHLSVFKNHVNSPSVVTSLALDEYLRSILENCPVGKTA